MSIRAEPPPSHALHFYGSSPCYTGRRYTSSKTAKLKRRVRKGIPDGERRAAWNRLAGVGAQLSDFPTLYEDLVASLPTEGGGSGGSGSGELTRAQRDVETDLYRTFPEHAAFSEGTAEGEATVASLRRVLYAYAAFDPALGYCQSLNFLAGVLLMYLPEREAFWHLILLLQRKASPLRGLYLVGMAETQACLGRLDGLIGGHLPRLAAHFQAEGVFAAMFATEW